MNNFSHPTQKLISQYQIWHKSLQPGEKITTIHVDEVASRVAGFYEKIRGIIDWKEEHLLKRGAIERNLKRKFFSAADLTNGSFNSGEIAESLILELIRAGHFPNDAIEETKIKDVQKIIDKYVFILNNVELKKKKSKAQFSNWILSIAACETEEALSFSLRERALIIYMFEAMREKIKLNEKIASKSLSEGKKNIQIYIAVQRALFNLDSPVISYHLLKYRYPQWKNLPQEQLNEISKNICLIWDEIENDLNHALGDKFYQICEKYDTCYLLLGDIISENPSETKEKIKNPELLETLIKKAYDKRLKTLKSRLSRAAFYSTLSIFLTKIIALLALEIPFTKYETGHFNLLALGVEVLIPTFLMYFLVITVRPPKSGNLERIIMETIKIVYDKKTEDVYEIKPYRKKGFVFDFIINVFYFLFFCVFLGLIILGLHQLKLPVLSYFIFIIFISLIAFTGSKIRRRGRELHIIDEKRTFLVFIIDLFAVPVIQLGNWLTIRWKKYNIIAVFFSALIDMPFLIFVEFIEQWGYFIKEKKEKIH